MSLSRQDLWNTLTSVLTDMLEEKGMPSEDIVPTATIEELGLSSIDAMHMMILLEGRLGQRLNFRELMDAGNGVVQDLTIAELMEQVYAMANTQDEAKQVPVHQSQPA